MPTFVASLKNDGDDRWLVEERQCSQRKPNEDAALTVPSGLSGRLRE
jgi:hypothetical protein